MRQTTGITPRVAFRNQRSDQPQQLLLLWTLACAAEKGSDVLLGNPAARSEIGFVPDEYLATHRIIGQPPTVAVCAVVKLSALNTHGIAPCFRRQCPTASG